MYDILELNKKLVSELKEIAKELKIKRIETLRKQDLIYKILDQQAISATGDKKISKEKKVDEPSVGSPQTHASRDNAPKKFVRSNQGEKKMRSRRKRVEKVTGGSDSDRINAAVAEVEANMKNDAPPANAYPERNDVKDRKEESKDPVQNSKDKSKTITTESDIKIKFADERKPEKTIGY